VCVLPAGFSWDEDTYLFCGTVDYSSVRTLFGRHPTPKDDLEGLACTLLEMASGEGLVCRLQSGCQRCVLQDKPAVQQHPHPIQAV
jgi:hypothetical protein